MFGQRLESKTHEEIRLMRRAGLVVSATLAMLAERVAPGVTTGDLDRWAEAEIRSRQARPSFPEVPGYRHTLCVSVNDGVVHGIPGERVLAPGDLVSIDCGAIVDGWHGDAALTVIVGGPGEGRSDDAELSAITERALWAGIAAYAVGRRLGEVGGAIEDEVERAQASTRGRLRLSLVEGYTGHGIGRAMHMAPDVHNYRVRGRTPKVPDGATIAIEPMVTLGSGDTRELPDGWTVVTTDGAHAAHWEHTVAVTAAGLWVLTADDGGQARLAELGAPYAPLD